MVEAQPAELAQHALAAGLTEEALEQSLAAGDQAMRLLAARDAIAHYVRSFRPSPRLAAPYAMLAVTAVCGRDDEEAQRLAAPLRVAIARSRTGQRGPIPSTEDALAYEFTPEEQAIVDEFFSGSIVSGPNGIAERIRTVAREVGANEVMLSTLVPDLEDRRASLERTMTGMRAAAQKGVSMS